MSTKHFVIDPNGTKHTRTSKGRVYAYAVVARHSIANALLGAGNTKSDIANFKYYQQRVAEGTVHNWEVPGNLEAMRAEVETHKTAQAYAEAMVAKRVAKIHQLEADGYYEVYEVVGWTSRQDLAHKLIGQFKHMVDHQILPAQIEAPKVKA